MTLLKAGWAKAEITPPPGYPMAGYTRRTALSAGVLDPLFARVLVLEAQGRRFAIVVADVLLLSNRWARRLRRRIASALRVAESRVIVAATHTHSGPLIDAAPFDFAAPGAKAPAPAYIRRVEARIWRAARAAMAQLSPVAASFAKVRVTGVASDRNRPKQFRTQPLYLLRFESASGAVILAIYGCHSTVLGYSNTQFSGDLLGGLGRRLEKQFDFSLVACGAAANISTRFTRQAQTPRELGRLSKILASHAGRARFQDLEVDSVSARVERVSLPFRRLKDPPPAAARVTGRLAEAAEEARENIERLRRSAAFRRKAASARLTRLRLGKISLLALPFEIGLATGEFLWRQRRAIALCYSNGYWGYIPPASSRPGDYEVISSAFPRETDRRLRGAALRLASRP